MEFTEQNPFEQNQNLVLASFWKRLVAEIIDSMVFGFVNVVLFLFYFLDKISLDEKSIKALISSPEFAEFSLTVTVLNLIYFTIMEGSKLQASAGKLAMGIAVGTADSNKIGFVNALIRNLAKSFFSLIVYIPIFANFSSTSGFLYILSCCMMLWNPERQALHDKVAKTFVFEKA